MDEGTLLEYRVARLLFHMGYFTRTRLPLKSFFYPEHIDITDIDVYAIKFDNDFNEHKILVDCKSGTSSKQKESKPSNRVLWLSGLIKFLNASRGYFIKPQITDKFKDFALKNGITPLDYARLEELETQFNLIDWRGSYSIENFEREINSYNNIKKRRGDMNQLYWFLKMDFWTLPSNIQIKQIVERFQDLSIKCSFEESYEIWLLGESIILFSIALLRFSQDLFPLTEQQRNNWINIKMIEGLGTIEQQEKLLFLSRQYAASIIEQYTGKKIDIKEDEVKIPPPEYTSNLIDLFSRILDEPEISIYIPRFLDFFIYEYIISKKNVNKDELISLFPVDLDLLAKLSKNIIKFLEPNITDIRAYEKLIRF
jgi:hypothetical protein